jgi:hypothetical protein
MHPWAILNFVIPKIMLTFAFFSMKLIAINKMTHLLACGQQNSCKVKD